MEASAAHGNFACFYLSTKHHLTIYWSLQCKPANTKGLRERNRIDLVRDRSVCARLIRGKILIFSSASAAHQSCAFPHLSAQHQLC